MSDVKVIPASSIASLASDLVGGSRAATHGDKYDNHARIAAVWNGILAAASKQTISPLDAHDVANLMEGMKIARRYLGAFNPDDYVDGAGYAACAGEIKSAMEKGRLDAEEWARDAAAPAPQATVRTPARKRSRRK